MELALSLGETVTAKPLFRFLEGSGQKVISRDHVGFCMGLGGKNNSVEGEGRSPENSKVDDNEEDEDRERKDSSDPPVQLDLLPFSPVLARSNHVSSQLRFPWLTENMVAEPGLSNRPGRALDMNRKALGMVGMEEAEEGTALSSPNSTVSSFQMDFSIYRNGRSGKRDFEGDAERGATTSRASDEEENAMARKKLRLTKEQSAFLEESFKEHNTLNPKQKLALAKQLNLRPRQVEVWFQNRRARTKLKQTEVDCEYLKRCCETLTEENRRLQKELQELRALKSSQPFYMQLPATTLTMCPSCERVATTTTTAPTGVSAANTGLPLPAKSKLGFPFSSAQVHAPQAA